VDNPTPQSQGPSESEPESRGETLTPVGLRPHDGENQHEDRGVVRRETVGQDGVASRRDGRRERLQTTGDKRQCVSSLPRDKFYTSDVLGGYTTTR